VGLLVSASAAVGRRFSQLFADLLLVDPDVLISPSDETVELSLAVKDVQALAVEALFLHRGRYGRSPPAWPWRSSLLRSRPWRSLHIEGLCLALIRPTFSD
jgi:hypothetical protein